MTSRPREPSSSRRKSATTLRRTLVDQLRATGAISSEAVAAAFASVPRERFIPEVLAEQGLEHVYDDDAFVIKRDERGMPLSSSSQPGLMARMLELLEVNRGDRVLEIGAGTGYNAALLASLAGGAGRVSTVDIDPAIVSRARRALRDAGFRASVLAGDGREGLARRAPYDRMIVTACADRIERAWVDQLRSGARLVVPLRLDPDGAAIQLIPAFERHGSGLRSVGFTWGGFMPLHHGDGGWSSPTPTLGASRAGPGKRSAFVSINGQAVERLSDRRARALLAGMLSAEESPLEHGTTDCSGDRPPLLLIYLLLRIPARHRVSVHREGRLAVGILDARRGGLGVVSITSPWRRGPEPRAARVRWRLDGYGDTAPASELRALIAQWRALRAAGQDHLRVTARGHGATMRLRFDWIRA